MAALFSTRLGRQASGYLQDKYKQARLALGDITPAELLVQEATNGDPCVPDAKTLACIADAAFDIDDYWRIANVLHRRLGSVHDWKEWRPVYKALVVLEFLLTHGPEELPRDFLPTMKALRDLRGFTYIDDKGFDWGASMQRRADSVVSLLTDADRLRDARHRAAVGVRSFPFSHGADHHGVVSPTASASPVSSASSGSSRGSRGTWSFASASPHYSDSPAFVCLCSPNADYRHDKKFDAYTADDKRDGGVVVEEEADDCPTPHSQGSWLEESPSQSGSPASCCSSAKSTSSRRASGFLSLSQPERRNSSKKLQRQLSLDY
ncbi:epsin-3-like [Lolium rigidum]|uniref:epsin-3-like n=1 Tax=Lolium rigidum TaxID=89674 RepID=UPI001F5D792D|nr:epsin-3-like [Lolium rigidum]